MKNRISLLVLTLILITSLVESGNAGGGGVVTSEPYANIEKAERYDKNLIANTAVTYAFKAPEHGIYEIVVTNKESENDITLRVEALKGTSKLVTVSPPGTVYKNVNIWAGTQRIKEALIRFKVENSWLTGNNVASSDVKMVKWDGNKWVQLEISEKTKDATFTFYEAKTDSFSSFAITGLDGVALSAATPAINATVTPVRRTETAPVITVTMPQATAVNEITTTPAEPIIQQKELLYNMVLFFIFTALFIVIIVMVWFGRRRLEQRKRTEEMKQEIIDKIEEVTKNE